MKAADPEQFFKYTRLLCCQQPTPVLPAQLLTPDWSSVTESAAVAAEDKNWLSLVISLYLTATAAAAEEFINPSTLYNKVVVAMI
jgi:hypothetical protein